MPSVSQDSGLTQLGDYVNIGYWSTIEVDVGVICACLPSIRNLLAKVFPSVLSTRNASGAKTPHYSQTRSAQSIGKSENWVHNRPTKSDDGDFIPLVEVQSTSGMTR
jgi:hypothetical protein